jgi:hypothetical protein
MIGWLVLGCAARTPVVVGPPVETSGQFLLKAFGRDLAGTAVVTVDDDSWALLGLGPTGTALFSVRSADGEIEVSAPDDRMAQVLGRIPMERDLWLLYRWTCEARCRAEHGILQVEGDEVRWRGRGGRATVRWTEGRAVLTDPRRRYELTVLKP